MTTTDKNRIIAEFMGAKKTDLVGLQKPIYYPVMGKSVSENKLKFHSDWSWLMEVVEKIESLGFDTSLDRHEFGKKTTFFIRYGGSNTQSGISKDNKIEAVYNACFEFIQWYNQNKN